MDALSDVLRAVRLSGAVFFDVQASEPWVVETPLGRTVVSTMFPASEHLMCYHVLLEGSCWVTIEGEPPMQLTAGDVIVFPHGDTHVMTSSPGMRAAPNLALYRRAAYDRLPFSLSMGPETGPEMGSGSTVGATPAGAHFVCGFLGCDAQPFNPLLAALPRFIHLKDDANGALGAYARIALTESKAARVGGDSVLSRLSELMFLHAVRQYIEAQPARKTDWLSGLRDEAVGRALAALHREPSRDWTLQLLALEAHVSRTVLAERFAQFVGLPPIEYLTHWRMQLASTRLRSTTESVATIANAVGYESEAAFSRAFKKLTGTPPSEWRRQVPTKQRASLAEESPTDD